MKVTMRELLENTAQRAISYLENIGDRSVAPSAEAVAKLATLDEPLNEGPTSADQVIKLLDEICSPATMAMAGPRFFGFVIGGSLPVTVAANWLAGAWDQNSGLYTPTPATSHLEQVALNWLLDLFKLPSDCGGAFVTGADDGKFLRVSCRAPCAFEASGLERRSRRAIWRTGNHCCRWRGSASDAFQVAGTFGSGPEQSRSECRWTRRGECVADAIPSLSGPTIVCVQAGNVNTGAFDPFPGNLRARA